MGAGVMTREYICGAMKLGPDGRYDHPETFRERFEARCREPEPASASSGWTCSRCGATKKPTQRANASVAPSPTPPKECAR